MIDCDRCRKDFRDFAEYIAKWIKEYYKRDRGKRDNKKPF